MSEQDPLQRSRLGLRGVLLVSGGVLVASSVFLLPNLGLMQGPASTTNLSLAPSAPGTPSAGPSGTGPGSAAESGGAAESAATAPALLPVYWVGDVDGGERLFREFRLSPDPASTDPISGAIRLMTADQPLDPDYRTPWREATSISSSISTRNVITIDISSDAFGEALPEDRARMAVQQLVYTATAAAANAGLIAGGESSSVVVLVDGAIGYRAFDAVDLNGEWTRDTAVLAPVWIIDPQQDVESEGPVTVQGTAPTDDDAVRWRIDRLDEGAIDGGSDGSSLFRDGTAEIERGQATGSYSFVETLPPGRYTITVSGSGPDGDDAAEDTKTVVVR